MHHYAHLSMCIIISTLRIYNGTHAVHIGSRGVRGREVTEFVARPRASQNHLRLEMIFRRYPVSSGVTPHPADAAGGGPSFTVGRWGLSSVRSCGTPS